jgi:PAS domain S-box-containing protein
MINDLKYTRSLIEASLDPLVTISAAGKITDLNEATARITGFQKEELVGTDFSDYFTEPQKALQVYQQVFADIVNYSNYAFRRILAQGLLRRWPMSSL